MHSEGVINPGTLWFRTLSCTMIMQLLSSQDSLYMFLEHHETETLKYMTLYYNLCTNSKGTEKIINSIVYILSKG